MEDQIHNMDNMDNHKSKKHNKARKLYISSVIALILALIALIGVTLSWFFYRRELDTLTWIKTPVRLDIRSGNNHDIAYLDLGSIDADTPDRTIERVFCVYGEPVDIYSLQLAYTTNIAFYYDIYSIHLIQTSCPSGFLRFYAKRHAVQPVKRYEAVLHTVMHALYGSPEAVFAVDMPVYHALYTVIIEYLLEPRKRRLLRYRRIMQHAEYVRLFSRICRHLHRLVQ